MSEEKVMNPAAEAEEEEERLHEQVKVRRDKLAALEGVTSAEEAARTINSTVD